MENAAGTRQRVLTTWQATVPVMLVPGPGDLRAGRGLRPAENVVPLVGLDAVARYGPRLVAGSWLRTRGLASMGGTSR